MSTLDIFSEILGEDEDETTAAKALALQARIDALKNQPKAKSPNPQRSTLDEWSAKDIAVFATGAAIISVPLVAGGFLIRYLVKHWS